MMNCNSTRTLLRAFVAVVAMTAVGCTPSGERSVLLDVVLHGGRVVDPASGTDAVLNVGIKDGKIAAISDQPLSGVEEIDVSDLVVAPGFIDLHAHQFTVGQSVALYPLLVRDGVTTALELEVGTSNVDEWYAAREGGQLINYGVSVGHVPVRIDVMDDPGPTLPRGPAKNEKAEPDQIAEMVVAFEQGLIDGALAIGFGLQYTPGASALEIDQLFQVAADHDALIHIHVRGSSSMHPDPELTGTLEAISLAERFGVAVQIAHANSIAGPYLNALLKTIEQARQRGIDVTTETYPYGAGMTFSNSSTFDGWESYDDDQFSMLESAETGERLTRESFSQLRGSEVPILIHARNEELTRQAVASPLTMIASDAFIDASGKGHPRAAGTSARILGKYVREDSVLSLRDALRKMTIDPARRLEAYVPAMRNKGRLSAGADADITVFDAHAVIDRATYSDPALPPDGIRFVLVNGVLIIRNGQLIPGVAPGTGIRVGH